MKKIITILFAVLLIAGNTFAQRQGEHHHKPPHHKMLSQLDLTDEQKAELETKIKALREEMKSQKGTDMSHEEKMEFRHQMVQRQKAIIESVLTEEQLAKAEAMKAEREGKREEHMAKRKEMKEKMKPMFEEMKAYKEANVEPFILEKRLQLEREMKRKDRKEVDKLRESLLEIKSKMKDKFEERKEKHAEMKKGKGKEWHGKGRKGHHGKGKGMHMVMKKWSEENPEQFEKAVELSEKYAEEIDAQMNAIKEMKPEWDKEMGEIKSKYINEEDFENDFKGKHGKKHHKGKKGCKDGETCEKKGKDGASKEEMKEKWMQMKRIGFLLKPTEKTQTEEPATPQKRGGFTSSIATKVYPNPSTDSNTLEIEVPENGDYEISLFNESGQLVRIISDDPLEGGKHTFNVDLSDLSSGLYYFVIFDGKSKTTSKFVKK